MGVQLSELFPGRSIGFKELSGRRIAIDAHNALHQFLAIIRQPDGKPLMDSKGRITSVYSGLFYRTCRLLASRVQPVYVFDGPPPRFKRLTIEERATVRTRARELWAEALVEGDLKKAKKYAQSALTLDNEMIRNSKRLLGYMGIPCVSAPSEGEAQAAAMAMRGDVWAASSQDFDSLLFGCPRLVRNLTITGRRKLPNKDVYVEISPEVIELERMLSTLGIDRSELVIIGLLVGTDYNQGGILGIGPKKALKKVREKKTLEAVMETVAWDFDVDFREIYQFFLDPPSTDQYDLTFRPPDESAIKSMLCDEFEFSVKRVEKALSQIPSEPRGEQTDLTAWA